MIYFVKPSNRFQRDLKRLQKRGYDMQLLTEVIKMLANGEVLAPKYHDHVLSGELSNCHECHITSDWLLVYEIDKGELYLYLTRTGTHSDLFK